MNDLDLRLEVVSRSC